MNSTRRLVIIALPILALWGVFGLLIVPSLLADAHAGHGFAFLSSLMHGRATHPLELYLSDWRQLFYKASIVLVAALVALSLLLRFRRNIGFALSRVTVQNAVRIDWLQALGLAAAAGIVAGFLEAGTIIVISLVKDSPRWGIGYTAGLLWMAPIANALAFLLLVVLGLSAAALKTRRPPLRALVFLLSLLSLYVITRSLRTGLHPAAVLILSIGCAVQVARLSEKHAQRILRWGQRTVVIGLLACLLLGVMAASGNVRGTRGKNVGAASNVLLIILDTGRASNFGLYGYSRATTPNIDRFARQATVFDRAIATAPWTLPSHASMFTGRWPSELSTDWNVRLDVSFPTVAEMFSQNGYRTGAFVANEIYAGGRSGLDRGFDTYHGDPMAPIILLKNAWLTRTLLAKVLPRGDDSDLLLGLGRKRARNIRSEFLRWTDRGDAPFFAFLNYMEVHPPFLSHEPYDTMFAGHHIAVRPQFFKRYSADQIRGFVNAYDQALTAFDADFARLLEGMGARGLLERTIIIVTADHGEQLGERKRGELLHANSLYLPSLHVPLIIYHPEQRLPRRIAGPVSLRDLAATLLQLAEIPNDGRIPGRPLPLTGTTHIAGSPAISQLSLVKPFGDVALDRSKWMQSLLHDNLHYIVDGEGGEQLYDVSTDPWERTNLLQTTQGTQILPRIRQEFHAATNLPR